MPSQRSFDINTLALIMGSIRFRGDRDFRKTKLTQRRTAPLRQHLSLSCFLASAEPRKETLVGSALLEDTAVLVVKGIQSFSISLHGSSEPQTDQTSNPRVEEKNPPSSLPPQLQRNGDRHQTGVGGGISKCPASSPSPLSPHLRKYFSTSGIKLVYPGP